MSDEVQSRSVQRRVAAQKGEPMPTFSKPGLVPDKVTQPEQSIDCAPAEPLQHEPSPCECCGARPKTGPDNRCDSCRDSHIDELAALRASVKALEGLMETWRERAAQADLNMTRQRGEGYSQWYGVKSALIGCAHELDRALAPVAEEKP